MNPRTRYDVLIIGGGVIGLACAHYLVRAGRSVRIIEQGALGAGASPGNCGLVFVSDLVPLCVPGAVRKELFSILRSDSPLVIGRSLDLDRLLWMLRFARRCRIEHVRHAIRARESILKSSNHLYAELMESGCIAAEYERRGVLLVYLSEPAMQTYAWVNEQLRPHGLSAEAVTGKALQDLEPALREDVFGGWYHRTDSHLRPDRLLQSWSRALVGEGVEIVEHCGLSRFILCGDRIQAAVTDQGEISAETYVLAAGAWSPQFAGQVGLRLPIQPGKGYSITMGRPALCPAIPCYLHERRVVATPWPSGYRLGGTMEFSGFSPGLNPERIRALKTAAGEYLKDPIGHPVFEEWAGLRPMTYDDLPVIGRAPRVRNLILATGHGMLGITTAPATGRLVAEITCGLSPHLDPRPFDPGRFP